MKHDIFKYAFIKKKKTSALCFVACLNKEITDRRKRLSARFQEKALLYDKITKSGADQCGIP